MTKITDKLRNFLIFINIIQERTIDEDTKESRVNPYNPLSYIFLVIIFLLTIIFLGIIGFFELFDVDNPFKWG